MSNPLITNLEIIEYVFKQDDIPEEVQNLFVPEQLEPVLFQGKPVAFPAEALALHNETEISANLVGYFPLIFPELVSAHTTWESLADEVLLGAPESVRRALLCKEYNTSTPKFKQVAERAKLCLLFLQDLPY